MCDREQSEWLKQFRAALRAMAADMQPLDVSLSQARDFARESREETVRNIGLLRELMATGESEVSPVCDLTKALSFARETAEENLKLREILREYKALRDTPAAESIDSRLVSKMDEAVKELKALNRGAAGRPTDA